ncbi:MAG: PepSY domain-containing protein [Pyrinomonadaceae bacterium]|nr:PepSY domain-containing protein [Blastocatellia bacterium]MCW5955582.1 PepSY domain-containing protein [Pyrinomonadaceae bacterium]
MNTFRKSIFWMHLVAGIAGGVVIFIMCVTGALLAFERNIIELSESEMRYVAVDASRQKLGPGEILEKVTRTQIDAVPTSISINREDGAAWQVTLGRDGIIFIDPYTGEIKGQSNKTVRSLMSAVREWHRWLAFSAERRQAGKAITGVSNLFLLFLAISGIYIWFPRKLFWKAMRPVIWFRGGLSGKARDFNWHNTIGFWCSLFLIVFTLTATVISYQWASNLLYSLTGNEVPSASRGQQQQADQESEFVIPRNIDAAWQRASTQAPEWKSISLKLPAVNEAAVFTIDEGIYWNRFGRSTLTVDTATVTDIKWEPYGERNAAQQLRSWFRFSHTGETGGIVGQTIGFVACVGGAFLVWTGFSLAFRRLANWIKRRRRTDLA